MTTISDQDMTRSSSIHAHDAEYRAVNQSGTYLFLVAIVAMGIALPLALLF